MPSTERRQRQIDKRLDPSAGGTTLTGNSGAPAGPAVPTPPAPQGLTVTGTKLLFSAVTPMASASLSWRAPVGVSPQRYVVQWATASDFTGAVTRVVGVTSPQTTEIDGLPVATLVYFRVAAVVSNIQGAWSATVSTTTPADTTAPAAPTSLVTAWSGLTGDLEIRWTNPTSANFRDVRVRIYASNGGTLLREVYSATGRYVWTRGQHYLDTSGAYDASVYVVLTARSWGGVFSATDLTGTATLAAPTTPAGLTSSWAGDTGTAGANCLITWTQSAAVAGYRLTIDGVARDVGLTGRYDYPFAQNQAEHAGTPDPVLSLSLVAVDALGQTSTAATATATNAAPPATTISAFGAFSSVGLTIAASAALDIQDYRVRVYHNAALVRTFYTTETRPTYAVEDGNGDYRFDVAARDAFGQVGTASSQTTALPLTDLSAFVAELRGGLIYTDSIGTAVATLAGLKDADTATNVITYATSASAFRHTTGDWGWEIVHQTSELYVAGGSSVSFYAATSLDGASWTFYSGGTATGARWQPVVQASEAAAQAAAVAINGGPWRVDLPAPVRARYIRLYHRNTTHTYNLREFFPSTLLRGTYVQAESITAVQIAAGAVTADKLTATAIDGFTITGATIRTAASGQRVEISSTGLRTYNSAGDIVLEATTSTNGALRAYTAAGAAYLNVGTTGIGIFSESALYDAARALRITNNSGTHGAGYGGYVATGGSALFMQATGQRAGGATDGSAAAYVEATVTNTAMPAEVDLRATRGASSLGLYIGNAGASDDGATVNTNMRVAGGLAIGSYVNGNAGTGSIAMSGGLNVGTTGAGTGEIRTAGPINSDRNTMIGGAGTPQSRLHVVGTEIRLDFSTTNTDRGILLRSASGFPEIRAGQVGNYGTAEPLILQNHGGATSLGGPLQLAAVTAPSAPGTTSSGIIYIDSADGDLKIRFGNGTTRTIATN